MVFTKKILLLLVLILAFACGNSTSEKEEKKLTDKQVKKLMNKALDHFDVGEYDQTEKLFRQLDTVITPTSDTIFQISFLFNKSELLKVRANYSKAISNYYKALKLAQGLKNERLIGKSYLNISAIYLEMSKVGIAHSFLKKAEYHFKKANSREELIDCDVFYAGIYSYYKKFDRAHYYLNKVINYAIDTDNKQLLNISYNNKANIYTSNENKKGTELYKKALNISREMNDQYSMAINLGNIGQNYLNSNEFSLAEKYIDSSLILAKKLGKKETELINYERLTELEKKKNNYKKALEYSIKTNKVISEINEIQSKNYFEQAKKQFQSELKTVKTKNKLILLKKDKKLAQNSLNNTRNILYFVIILILLFIITAVVFYKKRQEIASTKNKLLESETKRLTDELEFKRKELISFSLGLSEREKFIQEMKEQINKLSSSKVADEQEMGALKSLLISFHADGDADLHAKIEALNSSFHYKLKSNYPQLTDEDIRLASLIYLGTSSKDIATILSIETKSVNMKRYRLKKKLNLEQDSDLNDFLKNI